MSDFKYVMFKDKHGREFPVVFPGDLIHEEMASAVQHAFRSSELKEGLRDWACPVPISAGFCQIVATSAHGKSETLNMDSRPQDRQTINVYSYTSGMENPMADGIEKMLLIRTAQMLIEMAGGST